MKDHEKAKFINDLTEIAKMYGHTEQLRERISHLVHDVLEKENKVNMFSSDLDVFAKMGFPETAKRIQTVLNRKLVELEIDHTSSKNNTFIDCQGISLFEPGMPQARTGKIGLKQFVSKDRFSGNSRYDLLHKTLGKPKLEE